MENQLYLKEQKSYLNGWMVYDTDPGAFYHEPLHKIINPIVGSYQELNL